MSAKGVLHCLLFAKLFVSGWLPLNVSVALCPVSVAAMKEREITGGKGKGLNKWKREKRFYKARSKPKESTSLRCEVYMPM